jgi:signal transduction histidine kinase/HAMP domain-containing protein
MRLLLWHKIIMVFAAVTVVLSAFLLVATSRTLRALRTEVQHDGQRILAQQTEGYLLSLVREQRRALEARLAHATDAAIYASSVVGQMPELDDPQARDREITAFLQSFHAAVRSSPFVFVIAESGAGWYQGKDGRVDGGGMAAHLGQPRRAQSRQMRAGEGYWGVVYENPLAASYELMVDALSPIYRGGELWGHAGVALSVTDLITQFNQRSLIPGSYTFIIDSATRLIGAPPQGRVELAAPEAYTPRGLIDLGHSDSATLDAAMDEMALGAATVRSVDIKGDSKYVAFQPLDNIDWRLGLVVTVSMATAASGQLETTVQEASRRAILTIIAAIALMVIAAIGSSALLSRTIVAPLRLMTAASEGIMAGDFASRVAVTSSDELGRLGQVFNTMAVHIQTLISDLEHRAAQLRQANELLQRAHDELERRVEARTAELREAQRQLVGAAHRAGRTEVANNVLHNVGNVLNSVNVSAALVSQQLRTSRVGKLVQTAGLLATHQDDLAAYLTSDPAGKNIPRYLIKLAEHVESERQAVLDELTRLNKNIDHIRHIVTVQQNYAGATHLVEDIAVGDLIEDALRINAAGLERTGAVVVRALAAAPPVSTEKHKLLQILINLISNAKHALSASERPERTLEVRMDEPRAGVVRVQVIDNGVGISAENLKRLFHHRFTTRKDGHGFGLHGSAIAAREMGISLTAHSDGPGAGAVFTVEIPRQHGRENS